MFGLLISGPSVSATVSWPFPSAHFSKSTQKPRLRPRLNPPFLLITRTKSGFYEEFGPRYAGILFLAEVSVYLGPSNLRAKIAVFLDSNPSISRSI